MNITDIEAKAKKAKVKCIPGLHDGEVIFQADTILQMCKEIRRLEKELDETKVIVDELNNYES